MIELRLTGPVPSKKNSYRRRKQGGLFLPDQVRADIDALIIQAQSQKHKQPLHLIKGASRLRLYLEMRAAKPVQDLDNMHTTIQDVLQAAGVIENDRVIRAYIVEEVIDEDLRMPVSIVKLTKM